MTPNHVGIPIPLANMAWNYDNLMHGLICPVTISLGQVQPFGPRDGELFEAVLSQGVGGGANKKDFLFDFAKYVLFLAQYARGLRTLRLRIFKGKCRNLLESGWRGITFFLLLLLFSIARYLLTILTYDTYATHRTILYTYLEFEILTLLTLLTILYSTYNTKKLQYLLTMWYLHY